MKKIILLGYMSSGKTEIGKLLAKKLDLPFYDLDHLIENEEQKSVTEIFNDRGEIYFRKREHEIFKQQVEKQEEFILSLGGGAPCYANNHLFLQNEDVLSVFLKASVETLVERLKTGKKQRPLIANLNDEELAEYIAKHLFDRNYYYNHSKKTVVVDGKSPLDVVEEITKQLA